MNVHCPECDTVYRVDPDRVPAAGVRTQCEACDMVFDISASGQATAAAPASEAAEPALERTGEPARGPEPGEAATEAATPVFGPQDPETRAMRLARALVSDIVVYHPERHVKSMEAGTLRADFREEILKSWEEFVEQVGEEMAKKTPYFRDALNEILAKGQKVF